MVPRRQRRYAVEETHRTHGRHRPALEGPGRAKVMVSTLSVALTNTV